MAGSSDPRVVVIGARGQLGTDLMAALADWAPIGLGRADLDVTDAPAVEARLAALRPDVVVNCAAFHRVDECERDPASAFAVNAAGAAHIARAAARLGAQVVYISTDYVFDGEAGRPYTEADPPRPINVYGVSKLAGEQVVAALAPRHLIVRVAALFGAAGSRGKGGNFVETMIRKARAGETIRVVDDMVTSPTYSADAARLVRELLARGCTGIVHATNAGACTWHEFAQAIFVRLGWPIRVDAQRAADLPGAAPRPRYSALASERLPDCGVVMPAWPDALCRYLAAAGHLSASGGDSPAWRRSFLT